jgi:intracellular sulfur oxidation DsrE/DsrF family protein
MRLRLAIVTILAVAACAVGVHTQISQPQSYKVVFDLTSADPLDQQAVLRWISEIKATNPNNDTEVVMYGRGLDLIVAGKTTRTAEVAKAINELHATFKVCAIAMKNQQLESSQLKQPVTAEHANRPRRHRRDRGETAGRLGLHQGRSLTRRALGRVKFLPLMERTCNTLVIVAVPTDPRRNP